MNVFLVFQKWHIYQKRHIFLNGIRITLYDQDLPLKTAPGFQNPKHQVDPKTEPQKKTKFYKQHRRTYAKIQIQRGSQKL